MESRLPWYDSVWMDCYTAAVDVLRCHAPATLPAFLEALEPLRTDPAFSVPVLRDVFDPETRAQIEAVVASVSPTAYETHEIRTFGRFIVHDHPALTALQHTLVDRVGDAVGEPVDPSYNFLSLYTGRGVCGVHMDAPVAKWTLDYYVRQSEPWPIHVSQVVPWAMDPPAAPDGDWQGAIKADPANRFQSYVLQPGEAIIFSGSSQWHYRDPHPGGRASDYCDLLFFHFVPQGMADTANPERWADLWGVPELKRIGDWRASRRGAR